MMLVVRFGTAAMASLNCSDACAGLAPLTSLFCSAGGIWLSSAKIRNTSLSSCGAVPHHFGFRTSTTSWPWV